MSGESVAEATRTVETGEFVLHKFARPIGSERYEIRQYGRNYELVSKFLLTDRGREVPLSATLKYEPGFVPTRFEVQGRNGRFTAVHDLISVQAGTAHIRHGLTQSNRPLPKRYFMISGYAPIAVQDVMLRYWRVQGRPKRVPALPSGEIRIEHRGQDTVTIGSNAVVLDRYILSGLIWGREAIWLGSDQQLVAVIGVDAEFDHFEAVRRGYEAALPGLLASAGKDEMAALATEALNFPGRRNGKLALIGATLVDGSGRGPIPDAVVVIAGDRIIAADRRSEVVIPSDATRIDVAGKFILPGLWDMHAHFEQVEWGPVYLAAGITTVRDCGNEFEFIVAVRNAIRDGRGLGPRLLLAGLVDGTGPKTLGIQTVDDVEQAQEWVERYRGAGFQQMKIYSSMTLNNLEAVATAAHRRKMTVTGHVPEGVDLLQAVGAGMDQINHIHYVAAAMLPEGDREKLTWMEVEERIPEIDLTAPRALEVIRFLKAHDVVVDPTIAIEEQASVSPTRPFTMLEPGIRKVAPELASQYVTPTETDANQQTRLKALQGSLQVIAALHQAGVRIVAGTDQTVPGYSLYRELELYVEAGFTAMEAIQAATLVPAEVMGLARESGSVEVGKRADLIVLGANPLDSIHNIRTVEKVISGGTLYGSAELWKSVGFQP
jgi:imidazolonepropionase-like amidohydrolase